MEECEICGGMIGEDGGMGCICWLEQLECGCWVNEDDPKSVCECGPTVRVGEWADKLK